MSEVIVVEEELYREFHHKEIAEEQRTKSLGISIRSRLWFVVLAAFGLRLLTVVGAFRGLSESDESSSCCSYSMTLKHRSEERSQKISLPS